MPPGGPHHLAPRLTIDLRCTESTVGCIHLYEPEHVSMGIFFLFDDTPKSLPSSNGSGLLSLDANDRGLPSLFRMRRPTYLWHLGHCVPSGPPTWDSGMGYTVRCTAWNAGIRRQIVVTGRKSKRRPKVLGTGGVVGNVIPLVLPEMRCHLGSTAIPTAWTNVDVMFLRVALAVFE